MGPRRSSDPTSGGCPIGFERPPAQEFGGLRPRRQLLVLGTSRFKAADHGSPSRAVEPSFRLIATSLGSGASCPKVGRSPNGLWVGAIFSWPFVLIVILLLLHHYILLPHCLGGAFNLSLCMVYVASIPMILLIQCSKYGPPLCSGLSGRIHIRIT